MAHPEWTYEVAEAMKKATAEIGRLKAESKKFEMLTAQMHAEKDMEIERLQKDLADALVLLGGEMFKTSR